MTYTGSATVGITPKFVAKLTLLYYLPFSHLGAVVPSLYLSQTPLRTYLIVVPSRLLLEPHSRVVNVKLLFNTESTYYYVFIAMVICVDTTTVRSSGNMFL